MLVRFAKFRLWPALVSLLFCLPALEAQDRLPQSIALDSARVTIPGVTSPRTRRARDLGVAPPNTVLPSITLRFSRAPAQQAGLEQLMTAQQNPASPLYHRWLTPEEYASAFGLSASDLAAVSAWLQARGLTVTGVARSHSFLTVSGTAAAVGEAFATSIHRVSLDGETHLANLTDPALPAEIAGVVSGVTGLNDFRWKPRLHTRQVPAPEFTSSVTGSHYLAPGDFYTVYDINPLLAQSINGSGVTIAVMGQTDISTADVAAFRSAAGLSTTNLPTVKLYGPDPGIPTADDLEEAQLDVEWSGAVAPGATILYVNSQDIFDSSLTQAIDNNLAPILTISYGDCESGFGGSNLSAFNQLFQQAVVQGQTILGPGGDSGATDCDYNVTVATQGLAVDFPASSPYVTGVGGLEFNEAGGTYWSATNGAYAGSALSSIPETVWNDTALGGGLAAGGGGASVFFTKPSFQIGRGVPADASRDVPDVALNASADHDGYLFCAQGFCSNGFRSAAGYLDVVGGTSVSTPSFAGMLALLEQAIQSRVGNANPVIYGLANSSYYGTVFHDIAVGSNASPCRAGTPNCPVGGTIGYAATPGYDLASGWGSVDTAQMVNDWRLVTPAGIGSSGGATASQTTLAQVTGGSSGCVPATTAAVTLTFTATVGSAATAVPAAPTGTVQVLMDGRATGAPVTLVNGKATLTVSTAGLASGGHIVTAAYSGDTTYAASNGTASIDVASAATPDILLSASGCTLTVTHGAVSPGITYTLTSQNGFAGPVTLTASVAPSVMLLAGYSFTVDPVQVTAGGAPTTVFTISAYYNATTTGHPLLRAGGGQADALGTERPWELAGSGLALSGLLLVLLPRRRPRLPASGALALVLLAAGLLTVTGCSGSRSVNTSVANQSAVPGTYLVTVSATGTNAATNTQVTHTTTVTLVVN